VLFRIGCVAADEGVGSEANGALASEDHDSETPNVTKKAVPLFTQDSFCCYEEIFRFSRHRFPHERALGSSERIMPAKIAMPPSQADGDSRSPAQR